VGDSWVGGLVKYQTQSGSDATGFEPDWVTPGGSESGGLTTIQITAEHSKSPQLILIPFVDFVASKAKQKQQTELR
jgi:hypothetical protein